MKTTILGKTLRLLTREHCEWMRKFNIPFTVEGLSKITFEDAVLGVFICSMGSKEFSRFLSQGELVELAVDWGRKNPYHDRQSTITAFADYLRNATKEAQ